jgi:phospholipase DDHD1
VKAKFFADNKKNLRCEFIPVDWRSSLTLDDGIVESITPQTIKSIRNKLNSSALDIMYYTSPLFRLEVHILIIRNLYNNYIIFKIMNGLSSELNRLYNLFCEKNPYFKARNCKVSVVCHSLGII